MKTWHANKGITSMQVGVAIALVLLLSFLVVFLLRHEDAHWLQSAFERSVQKLQLIQAMSRDLLAAAEAEKSAVMAETDEASQAFAEQSIQASQNVEKARRELAPLLEGKRQEAHLFQEFSHCWDKLQEIDREVLSLAVQNTNLKALRLSFVPAAEAMRSMEEALNHLMDVASSSPDAVHITRLAAKAVMGALNMYMLQAPHIAESTVTRMDEMEAVMQSLDAQVTDALQSLQALVDEPGTALPRGGLGLIQGLSKHQRGHSRSVAPEQQHSLLCTVPGTEAQDDGPMSGWAGCSAGDCPTEHDVQGHKIGQRTLVNHTTYEYLVIGRVS